MYKYSHQLNTYDSAGKEGSVGFHDCKATRISLEDGVLTFYFQDGFDVVKEIGDLKKVYYTGESRLEFPLLYPDEIDVLIYIFTNDNGKTIREECELGDFMKLINEKKYSLEFLYEYVGYMAFRFNCMLWFDEKPYNKECELVISAKKAFCRWDDMYEAED